MTTPTAINPQHVAGIEEGLRALVQASWSESTGSMLHFFDPDIDRSSIANYMQDLVDGRVKLEGVDAKTLMLKLSRPSLEGLVASACQGGAAGLERLYRNGRNLFEDSLKTEYGLDLKKRTEDFINKSTLYHKVTEAVERKGPAALAKWKALRPQIRPIHRVEYGPGSGNTSHITQAPLFGSALIGSAATGASSILSPTPSTVTSKPTGHFDVQQMLQTISCKLDGLPTRDELMALKDQMWHYTNTRCNEMEGRLKAGFDAEIRRLEHKMELMQEQLQAGGGGSAEGLDGF